RIHRDRLLALLDGLVETVEEAVRPSEERMRLGSRVMVQRALVELHGIGEVAAHLFVVGLLEQLDRLALSTLGVHARYSGAANGKDQACGQSPWCSGCASSSVAAGLLSRWSMRRVRARPGWRCCSPPSRWRRDRTSRCNCSAAPRR